MDDKSLSQLDIKPKPIPLSQYPSHLLRQRMNELLTEMEKQKKYYYQGHKKTDLFKLAIFEYPIKVRSDIISFLNLGIMNLNEFLYHVGIGMINASDYDIFYATAYHPKVYYLSYHFLERLRLAQALNKSENRINNEFYHPNGISARHKTPKCYRCGALGHIQRNCKAKITNKNAGKWRAPHLYQRHGNECFKCGGTGHWQTECELQTKVVNIKRKKCYCFLCDSSDHDMEHCPDAKCLVGVDVDVDVDMHQANNNKSVGLDIGLMLEFGEKCRKCGQIGHWRDTCKEKDELCFGCKKAGHRWKDCPERSINTCYRCNGKGHWARDCKFFNCF